MSLTLTSCRCTMFDENSWDVVEVDEEEVDNILVYDPDGWDSLSLDSVTMEEGSDRLPPDAVLPFVYNAPGAISHPNEATEVSMLDGRSNAASAPVPMNPSSLSLARAFHQAGNSLSGTTGEGSTDLTSNNFHRGSYDTDLSHIHDSRALNDRDMATNLANQSNHGSGSGIACQDEILDSCCSDDDDASIVE